MDTQSRWPPKLKNCNSQSSRHVHNRLIYIVNLFSSAATKNYQSDRNLTENRDFHGKSVSCDLRHVFDTPLFFHFSSFSFTLCSFAWTARTLMARALAAPWCRDPFLQKKAPTQRAGGSGRARISWTRGVRGAFFDDLNECCCNLPLRTL